MRSWINGYKASENQSEIDYSNKNFIDTAFSTAQKTQLRQQKQKIGTIFTMEVPVRVEMTLQIKYSYFQKGKYIIRMMQKNMDLYQMERYMMRLEDANAVRMLMLWVHGEIQKIRNAMEMHYGSFVRQVALVMGM